MKGQTILQKQTDHFSANHPYNRTNLPVPWSMSHIRDTTHDWHGPLMYVWFQAKHYPTHNTNLKYVFINKAIIILIAKQFEANQFTNNTMLNLDHNSPYHPMFLPSEKHRTKKKNYQKSMYPENILIFWVDICKNQKRWVREDLANVKASLSFDCLSVFKRN